MLNPHIEISTSLLAGCCDDVKVTINDHEINFQKGNKLINGRAHYISDDAKWEVSYCEEDGGMWEICEK